MVCYKVTNYNMHLKYVNISPFIEFSGWNRVVISQKWIMVPSEMIGNDDRFTKVDEHMPLMRLRERLPI